MPDPQREERQLVDWAMEAARQDIFDAIRRSPARIDMARTQAVNDYIDALRRRLTSMRAAEERANDV